MAGKTTKAKAEKEVTGGELSDIPNEQYRKFFAKFDEIETLDVKEWKTVHILAYFCKKYKEQYGIKYQFKFNTPAPMKSYEVWQVNKLASTLTANPALLKEYIDWVYATKVVKAKKRLTAISFMTVEGIVNEYKFNVLLAGKKNLNVDRSTPLPEKYQEPFKKIAMNSIKTYGDLAFLHQMSDQTFEVMGAFIELETLEFDLEILKRIV